MKRILFVDDEVRLLESLRDALRPWRRQWHSTFAVGGPAAIAELERERFDVVVSDMRMPGMDGAAVLARVRVMQPQAVRIVLSGSSDPQVVTRAAAVAHQFLAKPCDVDALAACLERATELGEASRNGCEVASGAGPLPAAPGLYARLTALLSEPNVGRRDVAAVVECDIAVTAKVLQLANAAFYAPARPVMRVDEAISFIGLETLMAMVLSAGAVTAFRPTPPIPAFSIETYELRGVHVASLARGLAAPGVRDEAFAAGMLHDIGWLVLAAHDPVRLAWLLARAQAEGRSVEAVERDAGGAPHCELGAHLLRLWGLPDAVVEAVADHHTPFVAGGALDPRAAVQAAVALIGEAEGTGPADGLPAERLTTWRPLAEAALAA